jgi:hypothetical protein
MRIRISVLVLMLSFFSTADFPADASRVRRISAQAAQEGNVPIAVFVEGGGVLLDFSPTGELIQKISLDDPSRVVVDHCLVTKSCGNRPSPIIRLFRSAGIAFKDIPSAKVTMLSVETIDPQGEYHSYIFPLTTGAGRSTISKVLVGDGDDAPTSRPSNGGTLTRSTLSPTAPSAVALGAKVAESESQLVDPLLKGRVRQYLQLTNGGMSSKRAARKAGISMALVARLDRLGQSAMLPLQESASRPSASTQANVPPQSEISVIPVPAPPPLKQSPSRFAQRPFPKFRKVSAKRKTITPAVAVIPVEVKTVLPESVTFSSAKSQIFWTTSTFEAKPTISPVEVKPVPKSEPIALVQPPVAPALPMVKPKAISRHDYANALQLGLVKARQNREIRYGSSPWYRVNGAIRLLRRGGSVEKAISVSGLKKDGFMKLLSAGGMAT